MRKQRLNGQITVLAALTFGIIVSLMVVMIESAVCAAAITRINSVTNVSVQSLFSHYSRPVLEAYQVFGGVIYEQDEVLSTLYSYINANEDKSIINRFDTYGIKLMDIEISEIKKLTDDDGELFYKEIVDYMMLGQFDTDLINSVEDMRETSKKENIQAVSDEVEARQKEAAKIDEKILRLLMYVEGVKTSNSGFKQFFGKLTGAGSFVKKICPNGTGFGHTGVSNCTVYDAVSGKYMDITEELEQLKAELDFIKYVYNFPATKGMFIDIGFRTRANSILSDINNSMEKVSDSLDLITQIKQDSEVLIGNLDISQGVIDGMKSTIGDSLHGAFSAELNELRKYQDGTANSLCDINELEQKLLNCYSQLEAMQSSVSDLAGCYMDIQTIDLVYGMVDESIGVCKQYGGPGIHFNYENVTLGKGKEISTIVKIKEYFENNVMSLVLGDKVNSVSASKTSISNLSSDKCLSTKNTVFSNLSAEGLYEDFLYNRYTKLYCSSYVNPNDEGLLSYEMEYIIGDNKNDKANLRQVINELVNVRLAMNLSYIICDPEKKSICEGMSLAILGFTGVEGVIKCGTYLLLTAWAYAEAVNDVRILVSGGNVPLIKDKESWRTNLDDIVECRLGGTEGSTKGLDYEEYLQLLLFLENKSRKCYRTMDIIELNMIKDGYEHIRMYRYLYLVEGTAAFQYRNGSYKYNQKFKFSY